MKQYTFQTIVATAEVRAAFTARRDELSSSDKELMTAMFNLATANPDALQAEVERLQTAAALEKAAKKEEKAKIKQAADEAAKAARKAAVEAHVKKDASSEAPAPAGIAAKAPKRSRSRQPEVVSTSDEPEALVVDGTGN